VCVFMLFYSETPNQFSAMGNSNKVGVIVYWDAARHPIQLQAAA